MDTLPHLIEPKETATHSVIWLHGLGADGFDFAPLVPRFRSVNAFTRFIFPHAPYRPITINNGYRMRGWYDILTLDSSAFVHDLAGLTEARVTIDALINAEQAKGIPNERIMLVGFSQGGAVAFFTGLQTATPLAGILALSTYLPTPEVLAHTHQNQSKTPIMMLHGAQDEVIPLTFAERSSQYLQEWGYETIFRAYPMGHTVCDAELRDIDAFLASKLH